MINIVANLLLGGRKSLREYLIPDEIRAAGFGTNKVFSNGSTDYDFHALRNQAGSVLEILTEDEVFV